VVAAVAPLRVQRCRSAGWRKPAGAVYVGRPTRWGNPATPATLHLVVVRFHPDRPQAFTGRTPTVADCVSWYRDRVADDPARHFGWTLAELRRDLGGRDLMCWCPIGQPCHADVLIEYANPEVQAA